MTVISNPVTTRRQLTARTGGEKFEGARSLLVQLNIACFYELRQRFAGGQRRLSRNVAEELYPCRNVFFAYCKRLPMHCPSKVFFRKLLTSILKCINTTVMH